jgi:hypothetical protein
MRSLLELAEELGLEPGQSHTETSGDRVVRISVEPALPVSELANLVMLEPWFTIPPPEPLGKVVARFSEQGPPLDPVHIDEWDREPE